MRDTILFLGYMLLLLGLLNRRPASIAPAVWAGAVVLVGIILPLVLLKG
ncbi:MAG: hypothetical protein AVDCRST_MAG68-546 [uncultured Gemmatimonadetes bacterium]|uniref:Uncharacterized protein n=1 Tax=uncultured Gemmatimonadota bacterium TaxID=203437 RepID=A0A6J4KA23_9BACT|nr:MAG: hypothetical protein AVDCRST_MAG68-546 [uncultured Gemmatimonadota bacterium]